MLELKTVAVVQKGKVAHIEMNRGDKANAINQQMWEELQAAFDWVASEASVRAVVISGSGAHFCSGIDLGMLMEIGSQLGKEVARNALKLKRVVKHTQQLMNCIDECPKPVLAAIHGCCYGGGIDLVSACDIRYCVSDSRFSIKEVDMGLAADWGTLQRLPHIVNAGIVREMAYTGRVVEGEEALRIGLVNECFSSRELMMEKVMEVAQSVATKSPIAVQGTKEMLRYSRDHSIEDGLNYVATWNAAMLQATDLKVAVMAGMSKSQPEFED
ncbi:crotonase/enoyl-CoA hydratase family protein [Aestuariirhabdus litorea]|uniref:Crotonase/enoyl-CoA hydratase family protein n=1 Tax=Aestuariirhabdus litorea TaxID=2528527 RepID=A0A3P3VRF4_9GAMM|nr:crotonase/enoyl-CoA hydratase family protein [Aestuariirhabdus litorea]RRJ84887.1 crotonase/enoyl-CoA hydratase family protein [Aestuariirhabdus litorea]RWW98114.1 crotonase/enoyl-CoA hydratase family protein [Endozoicomonadaceae bacterium GTF-13]